MLHSPPRPRIDLLGLVCLAMLRVGTTHAQSPEVVPEAPLERPIAPALPQPRDSAPTQPLAPSPAADHALTSAASRPPRAILVPSISWPSGTELPETGHIEALLVIGRDGLAQLTECSAAVPICDAIRAALIEAEFEPAQLNGEPTAARVKVRFAVRTTELPPSEPVAEAPVSALEEPSNKVDDDLSFGARAQVDRERPTAVALELEEMREVPGTFGDPFRVIDALPGVIPVMTGLPYVYVRGAPPAATAYFYDDIQLPALFHLALGPAVVHPAMVGPIDFYPGVAPARYGRKTGGVVAGKAAFRPLKPGVHGELEVRLIDAQVYVAKPYGKDGRVEVAGRYGYPGLLVTLLEPRALFQYWDYQLRTVIPLSTHSDATLIALGSFDLVGERTKRGVERGVELQFHRLEARFVEQRGQHVIGAALSGGFERSGFGEDFNIQALRVGPKVWFETRVQRAALRFGADMLATTGKIEDGSEGRDEGDDFPLSDNPIYRSAAGRNVVGAYTELIWPLRPRWELEAGLRGDVWITGGDAQAALEPRALLRYQLRDDFGLHAAAGLAYQPAVFLIPLPGIADIALDRGLQRATQTELGASWDLPASFSIETKLFAHFYDGMLSLDAIEEGDIDCDESIADCEENDSFGRLSAYAYGSEWMIRRAYRERVSGWLSYTLSKADGRTDGGREVTPHFDVRHVANLVLQWRISSAWHVALRGYGQSGRFALGASTSTDPRERQRLPTFIRGDLQLARIWRHSWGDLRLTLDWLNFTFQREPVGWDCEGSEQSNSKCDVTYTEFPVTLPMLGVRGSY